MCSSVGYMHGTIWSGGQKWEPHELSLTLTQQNPVWRLTTCSLNCLLQPTPLRKKLDTHTHNASDHAVRSRLKIYDQPMVHLKRWGRGGRSLERRPDGLYRVVKMKIIRGFRSFGATGMLWRYIRAVATCTNWTALSKVGLQGEIHQ